MVCANCCVVRGDSSTDMASKPLLAIRASAPGYCAECSAAVSRSGALQKALVNCLFWDFWRTYCADLISNSAQLNTENRISAQSTAGTIMEESDAFMV